MPSAFEFVAVPAGEPVSEIAIVPAAMPATPAPIRPAPENHKRGCRQKELARRGAAAAGADAMIRRIR